MDPPARKRSGETLKNDDPKKIKTENLDEKKINPLRSSTNECDKSAGEGVNGSNGTTPAALGGESKPNPNDSSDDSDDDVPLATKSTEVRGRSAVAAQNKDAEESSDFDVPLTKKVVKQVIKAEDDKMDVDEDDSSEESDDVPLVQKLGLVEDNDSDEDFSPKSKPEKTNRNRKKKMKKRSKKVVNKREPRLVGTAVIFKASKYETREAAPLVCDGPPNRWWNDLKEGETKKSKVKWKTLEHNGVFFPDPYDPHGIKMLYDGKPVDLTPEQEEVATFFAVLIESDHGKKKVFQDNFFRDWKKLLGKNHVVKHFSLCDFSPIFRWAQERKEEAKEYRKLNREKIKEEKAKLMATYGHALVDGFMEKVGNFRVEPPGLFRGRGDHPKTGKLKRRVQPESITLNIGKGVPIPKCPIPGHNWKGVIHNPRVTWLAYWIDNINGDYKYVWLAGSSKFKGISDFLKYEKSRKLKDIIGNIRKDYLKKMKSKTKKDRELATATYLIDKLALRVGNEKVADETAETYGCCSLLTEHLIFKENNTINFHFLGKDSMLYDQTHIIIADAYNNLREFVANAKKEKRKKRNIFEINPGDLNDHLRNYMDGLSAKVFRTYNASITLQQELEKLDEEVPVTNTIAEKQVIYNRANTTVAILCSHQRSVPKKFGEQYEKMEDKLAMYNRKLAKLSDHIDQLSGSKKKKKTKKAKKEDEEEAEFKFSQSIETCKKQKLNLIATIQNFENKMVVKQETKQVALGTSKINYMDPRITVAWCKRKEMPIEKVFNASLLSKFPWAMEVESTWRY